MHSHLLVSGLPRSLPPLPPSPAPPYLPCVEGRQRADDCSPETLHMDVCGPACVSGEGRERYFLLEFDDYTRYTTVFPLRSKGEVSDVLIPWIRTFRLQLRERFGQDLPVLRLHSNRGGEFSSDVLRDFCRGEGILQSFTLLDSPQQNGIAECRIGLAMEVARTSMIHAAALHFLWPFAVRYAVSPCRRPRPHYVGQGRLAMRRCSGSGVLFYHPTLRRVFPSQDVTFDESVPFYHLFPYRSAPPPPPPLFLAPDPLPGTAPVQVAVGLGTAPGAALGGAASGGAESEGAGSGGAGPGGEEPGGAEPAGVETRGVEPGGAESEGAESGGAETQVAASSGGPAGAPQRLCEWFARRPRLWSGATGAGDAGDAGAGGAGVTAGAGGAGAAAAGPGGARTRGTRAAGAGGVEGVGAGDPVEPGATGAGGFGAGAGGTGAAGAGAVDLGARGVGDTVRPRPYLVPQLQQILGVLSSPSLTPPLLCPPPDQSQLPLEPASPLPAPSPYIEQSGGLTERREPASSPVSPVRTSLRVPRSRPPPVPGTHAMTLRPSSIPLCVPLPAPPESSLPEVPNLANDCARVASPIASPTASMQVYI
ncbi:unnamed protein product [Closterium sp. NIES-53]